MGFWGFGGQPPVRERRGAAAWRAVVAAEVVQHVGWRDAREVKRRVHHRLPRATMAIVSEPRCAGAPRPRRRACGVPLSGPR